ncbi:hypothetical protein OAA55_00760 [bacterium]|nr:hypothetical protein [bacterium]
MYNWSSGRGAEGCDVVDAFDEFDDVNDQMDLDDYEVRYYDFSEFFEGIVVDGLFLLGYEVWIEICVIR